MDREEVIRTLRDGMRKFVDAETDVTAFNYSLKPSKALADGGLGVTTREAWRGLFERYQVHYLPPGAPCQNVRFDTAFADATYDMELGDICQEARRRLLDE